MFRLGRGICAVPRKHGAHPDRITSYPHYSSIINLTITMPTPIKHIPRFEKQNNISINVYILEKSGRKTFNVVPTYLTKMKQGKHVNLLLIQNEEGDDDGFKPRFHYVWIKHLSRLVSLQPSKHHGQKQFCNRCLHCSTTKQRLADHIVCRITMNDCKVRLPSTEQANLQFKNEESVPFMVYADLECLLVPVKNNKQEHIPYNIGYSVKCSYDDSLSFYRSYCGEDCQQWVAR